MLSHKVSRRGIPKYLRSETIHLIIRGSDSYDIIYKLVAACDNTVGLSVIAEKKVVEVREGFEPSGPLLARQFSRLEQSTTLPPHLNMKRGIT